jgi:XRE family transcriptional regulator, aerobic/anaerobic benzoate catabolism transcriptional regulator
LGYGRHGWIVEDFFERERREISAKDAKNLFLFFFFAIFASISRLSRSKLLFSPPRHLQVACTIFLYLLYHARMPKSSTILRNYPEPSNQAEDKNPLLVSLGERVRMQRARRGLTRKALAQAADVSERHLANLEYGVGNASILVLQQVADALECPLAQLLGDMTTRNPEWLMLRELLAACDEGQLKTLRLNIATFLGAKTLDFMPTSSPKRHQRIALVGLRGAGKSTLGRMLAEHRQVPFFEMSTEIEKLAGASVAEIQALFGMNAYRRYERRVLEQLIADYQAAVIATPGGLVSDVPSFNLMLSNCTSVWLQADPQDHMQRVRAQGDTRPMAASREAMEDLKGILTGRTPFYAKADFTLNTSPQSLPETFELLKNLLQEVI